MNADAICKAFILAGVILAAEPSAFAASGIKPDEEVIFYSPFARQVDGGKTWELTIHGCVYEREKSELTLALLRQSLGLGDVHLTEAEREILNSRARLFLVDHERGKRLSVRVGEQTARMSKTGARGWFTGTVRLPVSQLSTNEELEVAALLTPADSRRFAHPVRLVSHTGLIVISDIDDTIKVTHVRDRNELLRKTFLEPFQAVPGMAEVYQKWAAVPRTDFWYVSASPWQLYGPLTEFCASNRFPAGVFAMKTFRWKDESVFDLFQDPQVYKLSVLEPLFKQFPQRRFVLVGDSGERDPETYAALARRHPKQVALVLIRNVTGEASDAQRYRVLFKDRPPGSWRVFKDPSEIAALSFPPM